MNCSACGAKCKIISIPYSLHYLFERLYEVGPTQINKINQLHVPAIVFLFILCECKCQTVLRVVTDIWLAQNVFHMVNYKPFIYHIS